jgi:hypothetical protein
MPYSPTDLEQEKELRLEFRLLDMKGVAYHPKLRDLEPYSVLRIPYLSHVVQRRKLPDIEVGESTVMGSGTVAWYMAGAGRLGKDKIQLSNAPQYASSWREAATHEMNHWMNPVRHPEPALNEAWNRYSTMLIIGDVSELHHPLLRPQRFFPELLRPIIEGYKEMKGHSPSLQRPAAVPMSPPRISYFS